MTKNFSAGTSKAIWRPTVSFWITAAVWLLFLIIAVPTGGFGSWMVVFALFLILTALYALLFGRRSWIGLPHRKGAGAAVGAGVIALIAGSIVVTASGPMPSTVMPLAEVKVASTTSASPSSNASASATPSSTPSRVPKSLLLEECFDDGATVTEQAAGYVCTLDDTGVLVWMLEKDSKALVSDRAEAKRVAEVKVIAEKMAAEKTVTDEAVRVAAEQATAEEAARVVAEQAVAEKAAADENVRVAAEQAAAEETARVVAEQAAADEAARVAAEEAAQQLAPAAAYYPNCTAAKAAGAAPIYQGQPGYRSALDRDNDGIACDK